VVSRAIFASDTEALYTTDYETSAMRVSKATGNTARRQYLLRSAGAEPATDELLVRDISRLLAVCGSATPVLDASLLLLHRIRFTEQNQSLDDGLFRCTTSLARTRRPWLAKDPGGRLHDEVPDVLVSNLDSGL
jgi:hypothetical protein